MHLHSICANIAALPHVALSIQSPLPVRDVGHVQVRISDGFAVLIESRSRVDRDERVWLRVHEAVVRELGGSVLASDRRVRGKAHRFDCLHVGDPAFYAHLCAMGTYVLHCNVVRSSGVGTVQRNGNKSLSVPREAVFWIPLGVEARLSCALGQQRRPWLAFASSHKNATRLCVLLVRLMVVLEGRYGHQQDVVLRRRRRIHKHYEVRRAAFRDVFIRRQ
mmetsp:Transcript_8898/g.33597  ORF Transcript_8898/g.33597 Transcript_8898/m.33597 type:complete len:220 (+) Transcript_8898:1530-2189(+)